MVDQGGFAGVGPADDRDTNGAFGEILIGFDDVVIVEFLALLGGIGHQHTQRVVEIAEALAMLGGNLHGIAEAERIGFHRTDFAMPAFALVGDQHHRLVGAAGKIGEGPVVRRQPGARVDHEHQRVGKRDRGFGLLLHPRGERALGAFVEPCGIDHGEFEIAETPVSLAAVAGDTGFVVDERELLSDQPVEQRRFSDIGPADNGKCERHK